MNTMKMMVLSLTFAASASAVIPSGDDERFSKPEGAGDGWSYVGQVHGASGVFLGNYNGKSWVMTNKHVGMGDYTVNGKTYKAVEGSESYICGDDMVLYQIDVSADDELAKLPNLKMSDSSSRLSHDSQVIIIGYGGLAYNNAIESWKVDTSQTPNIWSTNPDDPGVERSGYYYTPGTSGDSKRWATNSIENYIVDDELLRVNFDDMFGEGQIVAGDSGCGMFFYDEATDTWELAGIVTYSGRYDDQPDGTVVFGNYGLSISMRYYYDEIYAILMGTAVPEPSLASLLLLSGGLCIFRRVK